MNSTGRMTLKEYEAKYGRVQESASRIPAPGVLSDVATILPPKGNRPLSNAQINQASLRFKARIKDAVYRPHEAVYDESRIAGVMCRCDAGMGRFRLLPFNDSGVQEGGKRYMQCETCGGWSHL